MDDNKIVEVCAECGTAACWYGEFMCDNSRHASTIKKTVKELRETHLEDERYWSDMVMEAVYGEPAPFGFKEIDG